MCGSHSGDPDMGTSLVMAGGQVSNLWSCTTLGDGLDMVGADLTRLQDEEAQLLAELQGPRKVVQISWLCWYLWSGSITVSKIKVVLMNLVVTMLVKERISRYLFIPLVLWFSFRFLFEWYTLYILKFLKIQKCR